MTKLEQKIVALSFVLGVLFCVPSPASAMHIMEGYLPPAHCIVWGILCLPFLVVGILFIRHMVSDIEIPFFPKPKDRRSLILLAMAGAFIFVISSLKIPSVTGSCSHMTGTGLSAILFGPAITSVLGLLVLVFQALLLAHGGITTLGANLFSMAIAGPILSWGIWSLAKGRSQKTAIFLAAFVGDIFTYCFTSIQLGIANPSANGGIFASTLQFLVVFAPTQLPLAIIEGILTILIVMGLESYAKPELKAIGFLRKGN